MSVWNQVVRVLLWINRRLHGRLCQDPDDLLFRDLVDLR